LQSHDEDLLSELYYQLGSMDDDAPDDGESLAGDVDD